MDFAYLTTTSDESEARVIASVLEAEGIQVEIRIPPLEAASAVGTAAGSAARGMGGFRQLFVPSTALDDAQMVLRDLPEAVDLPADGGEAPGAYTATGTLPVLLHDVATGELVGEVDEADLGLLRAKLVAESDTDDDFYINVGTIESLVSAGASPPLIDALRRVLHDGEGDVRWSRRS